MALFPRRLPSQPAFKWLGFVTAVWVQAISGNNYTFSNYSDALKSLMDLAQLELNDLSVGKDVGKAFGLLAGFASDKISPWALLLIGSVEGLVGYGAQWLVVIETISPLPYWAYEDLLGYGRSVIAGNNRGPVAGILKGYVGLSTAIFTDLCDALFSDSSSDFLAMLPIAPFVDCLTAMIFLREVPPSITGPEDKEEIKYFNMFNIAAVVVAVYLLAYDFVGSQGSAFNIAFSSILMILLASPLIIPAYIALLAEEAATAADVKKAQPALGEDHTIIQAFKSPDFWVLFASFLCGVGPGMVVMNNMGQMGSAPGYTDVSIFVSLLGIMGFLAELTLAQLQSFASSSFQHSTNFF
ncbi:NUCLEAR FUSION DEFECTIVE 4-like protein [Drosera capensis]